MENHIHRTFCRYNVLCIIPYTYIANKPGNTLLLCYKSSCTNQRLISVKRGHNCVLSVQTNFSLFAQCHFIYDHKFVTAEKAAELGINSAHTCICKFITTLSNPSQASWTYFAEHFYLPSFHQKMHMLEDVGQGPQCWLWTSW